ncbi:hypothetical protein SAMN05444007_11570 [Cribrihabitans marinus]|uniref:Uncharacterized protein n=1 Tax=Cribrihabitans marinus TaxID=1227549 RepID=A0A1H7DW99_9RHOB|nr:hypothetical protein SAMN05444007_11570 [Cribrihabitans marinus]
MMRVAKGMAGMSKEAQKKPPQCAGGGNEPQEEEGPLGSVSF